MGGTSLSTWTGPSSIITLNTHILQQRQPYGLPLEGADETPNQYQEASGVPVSQVESVSYFRCPFFFLLCPKIFANEEEWFDHSTVHLRPGLSSQIVFPSRVACPLTWCNGLNCEFADPQQAWRERMNHVAFHHRSGHTVELTKESAKSKDKELFNHLKNIGAVNPTEYQDLVRNGILSESPPSVQQERHSTRSRRRNRVERPALRYGFMR